jgi:DNA-binding transcriptional MerR regulator
MATQPIQRQNETLIPDRLYFKIGDVAVICGVAPSVLRFWESQFPQLKPNKSGTGQRLYRRRDVELALEIKRLVHDEGFTLAGARQALNAKPAAKHGARIGMRLHRSGHESAANDRQPNLPMIADEATRLRAAATVVSQTRNELRLILSQLSQPVQISKAGEFKVEKPMIFKDALEEMEPAQMGFAF